MAEETFDPNAPVAEPDAVITPEQAAQQAPMADLLDQVADEYEAAGKDGEGKPRVRDEKGKFKAQEQAAEETVAEDVPEKPKEGEPAKVEAEKPVEEADPEVDGIEKPKGLHPKKLEGWNALTAKAKERGKLLKEREAEIATVRTELEAAKKSAPLSDEERKELQDLRDFQFMHEPEKSGKITREYDAKMDAANESIYPLLKAIGVVDTVAQAKALSEANDGAEFLSIEAIKAAKGIKSQPYAWWEKNVLENPAFDGRTRGKFRAAIDGYFNTAEAREEALQQAPKDREAWSKRQQEEQAKANQEYGSKVFAEANKLRSDLGDWAMEKTIPPNATPEARAAMEAHNKFLRETIYPAFNGRLDVSTPESLARTAMGMETPLAIYWQREAEARKSGEEAAKKEAKAAQDELSRIRGAGKVSASKTGVSTAQKGNVFGGSIETALADAMAGANGR